MNTLPERRIKNANQLIIDRTWGQFIIKGYSTPFRLDRNQNGEG